MLLPFGRFEIGQSPIFGGIQDFYVIFGQVVQTSRHLVGGEGVDPVRAILGVI